MSSTTNAVRTLSLYSLKIQQVCFQKAKNTRRILFYLIIPMSLKNLPEIENMLVKSNIIINQISLFND